MRASARKRKRGKVQKYQVPELQHVGSASEVVLGVEDVGGDVWGMQTFHEQEFEKD
jgi:hypothetical protein